jgi:hypothetical protein
MGAHQPRPGKVAYNPTMLRLSISRFGDRRYLPYGRGRLLIALCLLAALGARADTFRGVHYDPTTNELVVTMSYDGSNPDHHFSVQWGQCRSAADGGNQEIAAEVLDDQFDDVATQPFTKTVRFSLAGMTCRPAKVTLHCPPRFYTTVMVP